MRALHNAKQAANTRKREFHNSDRRNNPPGLRTTLDAKNKSDIFEAVRDGDLNRLDLLLDNGADKDSKDEDGVALIHVAVSYAQTGVIRQLLSHGVSVDGKTNENGMTPLYIAVRGGDQTVVNLLLEKGANVTAANHLYAALSPYYHGDSMVELLLEHGAVIPSEEASRLELFHLALENDQAQLVRMVLDAGVSIDCKSRNGGSLLHCALNNKCFKVARVLIEKGIDVDQADERGETPLYNAASDGNLDAVRLLLASGASIDKKVKCLGREDTPLGAALFCDHLRVAKLLLERGASVYEKNSRGKTPLHIAIGGADYNAIEAGVSCSISDSDHDSDTDTEYEYSPGSKSKSKDTISQIRLDVIKLLLNSGVNICEKDKYDTTPFYTAVVKGYYSVVKLFLEHTAPEAYSDVVNQMREFIYPLRQKTVVNRTLLNIAVQLGNAKIVSLLLQYGAKVDVVDALGYTELFYAIEKRHMKVLRLLLEYGASLSDDEDRKPDPFTVLLKVELKRGYWTTTVRRIRELLYACWESEYTCSSAECNKTRLCGLEPSDTLATTSFFHTFNLHILSQQAIISRFKYMNMITKGALLFSHLPADKSKSLIDAVRGSLRDYVKDHIEDLHSVFKTCGFFSIDDNVRTCSAIFDRISCDAKPSSDNKVSRGESGKSNQSKFISLSSECLDHVCSFLYRSTTTSQRYIELYIWLRKLEQKSGSGSVATQYPSSTAVAAGFK